MYNTQVAQFHSDVVFIGESAAVHNVRRLVKKLGPTAHPILIVGETGTGKEIVAKLLHQASCLKAFVPIDCTTLVSTIAESQLFGHAAGSFTGASKAQSGLIEAAHGGTAFFDEIGDLSLINQVKLLRLLEEKEFRAVGDVRLRTVEFRPIAATNKDLEQAVAAGSFRRDLLYRLNVTCIAVPPLRERREDIPSLVAYFLGMAEAAHTFTRDAMEALMEYDWPGNVRELRNIVYNMIATRTGPMLGIEVLPERVRRRGVEHRQAVADAEGAYDGGRGMVGIAPVSLREVEKVAILSALHATGWNIGMTADVLGIGRTTLYRKLKEYGVKEAPNAAKVAVA